MKDLGIFEYMKKYRYENLLLCQDDKADFKAVIAIHSTLLGPAAGGVRMWEYGSEMDAIEDALRLARGMTYKYSAAGVNMGGGKAVIIADPKRSDREVVFRTLGRFINRLQGKFYSGEDVGTTLEDMEYLFMETPYVITLPQYLGGVGPISPLTAFGVIQGMKACTNVVFGSDDLKGKAVAIQGVGAVGSSLVEQLSNLGCRIVISDIDAMKVAKLVGRFGVAKSSPDAIYDVECDIFSPCALGGILNDQTLERLRCKIVCGAANNQLRDERHGDLMAQKGILYAPDYIVNAGGAIYDADRLVGGINLERGRQKVERIFLNTKKVLDIAEREGIPTYRAADILAEERIEAIAHIKRYWDKREIR
jgi:leucine dehydrogenase